MSKSDHVYQKLPYAVQKLLINIHGYRIKATRYNKNFKKFLKEYKELYLKSEADILSYQKKKLAEFLKISRKSLYWQEQFKRYKVNVNASDVYEEIRKLPILTKAEVKKNIQDIKIVLPDQKISKIHTSGTTGSGLTFYQTEDMINRQWAVWWRYRSWHGISDKSWCGWFGGKVVISANRKNPPFWHVNRPGKQLMFSPLHLNEKTIEMYHLQLLKRKISWLHGYPSQLTRLALLIEKSNLPVWDELDIITIGAENLYDYQKEIIERVFSVPVRQHYGLSEGVANISEKVDGTLSVDRNFCFTEFIKIDGSKNLYKIIGTNFSNTAFPLFRYDTGDIATLDYDMHGKEIIKSIEGRGEDYLTLPDGGRLGPFNLIMKEFSNVEEAQLLQEKVDKIVLRVVKSSNYSEKDEKHIFEEIESRLTCKVDFKIEYLEVIPKTKNGKLQGVISFIN